MSELKPCPFCGMNGEAKYTVDYGGRTIFQCQWCGASHHSFDDWNNRPIEDELRARIAELEEAQRWIPVSERLPQIYDDCEGEKSDCCYVRDIHKCVWIAYYRPDEKDWYGLPTGIILTAITHWMPLPQLPEVKE